MTKHIAFNAVPSAGHVIPTLPLVRELTRRGHRVSYATGAEFASAIEAAGATPVALDWNPPPIRVSKGGQTTADLAEMLLGSVHSVRRVLPATQRWLTADRPDLICYDVLTALGGMLAHKFGLRAVATVPTFAGNDEFDFTQMLAPRDFDPSHPTMLEYFAEAGKLAQDFDLSPDIMARPGTYAELNLVFIPREFQIRGETFGDAFHFIGPSFGNRDDEDWAPPADGRPLLFVSLGTTFNDRPDFFASCAEAFRGTDWQVAMALGHQVDPAQLGEIPANVEVRQYIPQAAVLRHATVFLSHAGMGSVMESLMRQVPLVVYPQTPEQTANAHRVEELGLGRQLDVTRDPDPGELRRTVEEVAADQGIRANVVTMAEHIRATGGPAAGADAIEALLA
ncbi:macrolide family glycosyltransferase [Amycolatopsis anabasis]|uniref:macrolide family glycosyltransferase n=1 Tax=Amycolatopsis anabasis TaxID=1840409 RepID=UPI00131E151A|nr:macrolide family glycosyltransferase [Amycolatopsis anabasis]